MSVPRGTFARHFGGRNPSSISVLACSRVSMLYDAAWRADVALRWPATGIPRRCPSRIVARVRAGGTFT